MIIKYRSGGHWVDCGVSRKFVLQKTVSIVLVPCDPVHHLNDYLVYHTGEGRLDQCNRPIYCSSFAVRHRWRGLGLWQQARYVEAKLRCFHTWFSRGTEWYSLLSKAWAIEVKRCNYRASPQSEYELLTGYVEDIIFTPRRKGQAPLYFRVSS